MSSNKVHPMDEINERKELETPLLLPETPTDNDKPPESKHELHTTANSNDNDDVKVKKEGLSDTATQSNQEDDDPLRDKDDAYVGNKAAILSLFSGFLVVLPTFLLPISFGLPWAHTVVHGSLYSGNSTIDEIWDYRVVRSSISIYCNMEYLLSQTSSHWNILFYLSCLLLLRLHYSQSKRR